MAADDTAKQCRERVLRSLDDEARYPANFIRFCTFCGHPLLKSEDDCWDCSAGKRVQRDKDWMRTMAFLSEDTGWETDSEKCVCLVCSKTFKKSDLCSLEQHIKSASHKELMETENA